MTTAVPIEPAATAFREPIDYSAVFQREINSYVRRGYRVVSQTQWTCQLVRPKKFSLIWAVIWFLLMLFPFILYLLYYAGKRDEQVYLTITADGKIQRK